MNHLTIAESQPIFAEGLQKMLSQIGDLHQNPLITCYQELVYLLQDRTTDLLLLDAQLNTGLTEVLLVSQIKKEYPAIKIALFGQADHYGMLSKLRKLGLEAYLHKDISCQELKQAISCVLAGKSYLQESVSRTLNCFDVENKSRQRLYKAQLSKREIEVLTLIVEECTNQEIANTLFISIPTVETHRKSLLIKLGVKNTAGLVRESLYRGWYPNGHHGKP